MWPADVRALFGEVDHRVCRGRAGVAVVCSWLVVSDGDSDGGDSAELGAKRGSVGRVRMAVYMGDCGCEIRA